jgi:hypothetical protein
VQALREILADTATFRGPLRTGSNGNECIYVTLDPRSILAAGLLSSPSVRRSILRSSHHVGIRALG